MNSSESLQFKINICVIPLYSIDERQTESHWIVERYILFSRFFSPHLVSLSVDFALLIWFWRAYLQLATKWINCVYFFFVLSKWTRLMARHNIPKIYIWVCVVKMYALRAHFTMYLIPLCAIYTTIIDKQCQLWFPRATLKRPHQQCQSSYFITKTTNCILYECTFPVPI